MSKRQWLAGVVVAVAISGASAMAWSAGDGDYSVLVVANVDEITADGTLERLAAAGYEDFVKEGSADAGFDVYLPGLSLDAARSLAEEVKQHVGYARAWETAKLP